MKIFKKYLKRENQWQTGNMFLCASPAEAKRVSGGTVGQQEDRKRSRAQSGKAADSPGHPGGAESIKTRK